MNNIFENINLDKIWLNIKRIPKLLRNDYYVIMISNLMAKWVLLRTQNSFISSKYGFI